MIFRIALRYLIAPKSHRAVNVISMISMGGVAVAAMAMVVVMSVFNGFSDLARRHLSQIDPTLRIEPASGKIISDADAMVRAIEAIDGVSVAMPVLQERALVIAGESQLPVVAKGLPAARAAKALDMDALIIDGVYQAHGYGADSTAGTQLSVGVAMSTGLRPGAESYAELYVPRRTGRIDPANPMAAYRSMPMVTTGVFRVDQPEYDTDLIFVPLEALRTMLEYPPGAASAIEVTAADGASERAIADAIRQLYPSGITVLDRQQQQADTFRMISVEKWVTFLMLIFILLIASFNIISTLSLLIIEKRTDMQTLRFLGAPLRRVHSIFVVLGMLITCIGGAAGAIAGVILSAIQQHFGIIRLGADPSALSIDVYPVALSWPDVALTLAVVAAMGLLIGQSSRVFLRRE